MINWLANWFHKKICIHKFGKVEDGYQYCEHCGVAKLINKNNECQHKWEKDSSSKILTMNNSTGEKNETGSIYILRCKLCGNMKEFKSELQ